MPITLQPHDFTINALGGVLDSRNPAGVQPNRSPVIATIPDQTRAMGSTFSLASYFSDPDGDALTCTRTGGTAPAGVTVSTAGTVAVSMAVPAGSYTVGVSVDDGRGGSASRTFNLAVFLGAPVNLAATALSSSSIGLTWNAVAGATYKIYRNGTFVGSSATPSYSDVGLAASTLYTYTVSAVIGASESAQSSNASATTQAVGGGVGVIFQSDLESGTLGSIFSSLNTYGGVSVELSTDRAYSGTRSIKIAYPVDEAGVELQVGPFPPTPSLYTRKREYFAPGWEANWPVGLKTSRYFTRNDFSTGPAEPNAWAYCSEKFIWQTYSGNASDLYGRGLNHAIFNLDLEATYPAGTNFGNGLPYIRTGHWYKFETWMVLNSSVNVADGILRCWIDDQIVLDLTNVVWRSTSRGCPNGTGWQSMWFGGNYSGAVFGGPSAPVYRYIDDLYLSTTLDR